MCIFFYTIRSSFFVCMFLNVHLDEANKVITTLVLTQTKKYITKLMSIYIWQYFSLQRKNNNFENNK